MTAAIAAASSELLLTSVYQAMSLCVEQIRLLIEHAADDDRISVEAYDAMSDDLLRAEADLAETAKALYLSDEPCTYTLRDGESGYTETVIAASDADARRKARQWARRGDWDLSGGTIWIDVDIVDLLGDEERVTVQIDPPAPRCRSASVPHDAWTPPDQDQTHEWCSPIEVVGGIAENPGVHGHGGGVEITEVCSHCGTYRITDTWAQRRDTGEQGLRSVQYSDADEESLAWISEKDGNDD